MNMRVISVIFSTFLITACGGGVAPETYGDAPGGLYLGYYAEKPDPSNIEDDPTMGAFVLNLPERSGMFSGKMRFTYVGCQTEGKSDVSGDKNSQSLTGTWDNFLDGHPQAGTFSGKYATSTQIYSGTYKNDVSGSQRIDVSIQCTGYFDHYYVADNGTWEMFPLETNHPSNFVIIETPLKTFRYPNLWPTIKTYRLVYVIDPEIAVTSGNPVLWQSFTLNDAKDIELPKTLVLQSRTRYVLVVGIADATYGTRLAFSSKSFIAP